MSTLDSPLEGAYALAPDADDAHTAHITDLFSPAESAQSRKPAVKPAPASAPNSAPILATTEFDFAVGLICVGYAHPELHPTGYNRHGNLNVEFVFELNNGESPRAVEDRFHNKLMLAEVGLVQRSNRELRKRINRLSKELGPAPDSDNSAN